MVNEYYGFKYFISCEQIRWEEFYKLHHAEEEEDLSVLHQRFSYTLNNSQEIIEFVSSVIDVYEDGLGVHEYTMGANCLALVDKAEKILQEYSIVNNSVTEFMDNLKWGEKILKKYYDFDVKCSKEEFLIEIGRVNIFFYRYFHDFIVGMHYSVLKVQQKSMMIS